jgi:hypothetical protein
MIKTGIFGSENISWPGIFSLFLCFRQHKDHTDLSQSELAQLHLKAHETTTGLSNKYIAKLVKAYHHAPLDFPKLHILLVLNFDGICTILFGTSAHINDALTGWTKFPDKGSIQPLLPVLNDQDPLLAAKVGWFIEQQCIQCYLNSFTEVAVLRDVNTHLLEFLNLQLCLEEGGDFSLPICDFLPNKFNANHLPPPAGTPHLPPSQLHPAPWHTPQKPPRGSQDKHCQQKPPPGENYVTNNNPIYHFDQQWEHWPTTFLDKNLDTCPVIGFYLKFHMKGWCFANCICLELHQSNFVASLMATIHTWITKCRALMPSADTKCRPTSNQVVATYSEPTCSYVPTLAPSAANLLFSQSTVAKPSPTKSSTQHQSASLNCFQPCTKPVKLAKKPEGLSQLPPRTPSPAHQSIPTCIIGIIQTAAVSISSVSLAITG